MNTNQLYKEYARVIEMCECTELEDKPWRCLQWRNIPNCCPTWRYFDHHPNFEIFDPHSEVRFAVAVLEGKPVFVEDIEDERDKP